MINSLRVLRIGGYLVKSSVWDSVEKCMRLVSGSWLNVAYRIIKIVERTFVILIYISI